jgi:hypothetical protein
MRETLPANLSLRWQTLCHCCSNAVRVQRDTGASGRAKQRVCLGRTVQQVQPRDAEQFGLRWPWWIPGTALPAG